MHFRLPHNRPNQSMKPTAPLRNNFSVFATTPCRGLSPSRWMHFPSSARRIVPRRRARTLLQHLLTQHRHFCLRHVLPEYSSPHGVLSPVHPSTRRSESQEARRFGAHPSLFPWLLLRSLDIRKRKLEDWSLGHVFGYSLRLLRSLTSHVRWYGRELIFLGDLRRLCRVCSARRVSAPGPPVERRLGRRAASTRGRGCCAVFLVSL